MVSYRKGCIRVLITGNKGQLGNELCELLARGESELGSIPEEFRGAEVIGIDLDRLDITNKEAVLSFVKELHPELIINCAAYTNVDACETHEEDAYQANAIGPRNLAEASETLGAKFVHISTDYVFNGQGRVIPPRPYREDDEPDPVSAYGRTKLASTDAYGIYHCTGKGQCSWYEFAAEIMRLGGINARVTPCSSDENPSPTKRPAWSVLSHEKMEQTVGDDAREWEEALKAFFR